MSYHEKKEVIKLRKARKSKSGGDNRDDASKYKSKIAALEKALGKRKRHIFKLKSAKVDSA